MVKRSLFASMIEGKTERKLMRTKIELFVHKMRPSLDECSFKSHLKVCVSELRLNKGGSCLEDQLAMILRPAVVDLLRQETQLCRLVLYETHRLCMKDGALPDTLVERRRVLRSLFDHFYTDFNKLKSGNFVPDFLLPMLTILDITPLLISYKEATVLY